MTGDPFVAHRGLLFTVAYEMLGSAADAEDVVQESWLRWADVDRSQVRDPRSYLIRVVTRQALNNVVNGKSGISPEMAIRLTKAFGSTPETWLRMQLAYDLAAALKNESKIKVHRQRLEELHAY